MRWKKAKLILSYFRFRPWHLRLTKMVFWLAIIGIQLLSYNNCSRPYDIQQQSYSGPISFSALVSVAQSSQYTNKPEIPLAFSFVYSPMSMYITFAPDCTSGGNWVAYTPQVTVPWPNPDGLAKVFVKFRNHSNVETVCYEASLIVDTHAPNVGFKMQPAAITNSLNAHFQIDAQDSMSGVEHLECSLDQSPFGLCLADLSYEKLGDGVHTFSIRAFDNAGNMSSPTTISWRIDTHAPTLLLSERPPLFSNHSNANFQFAATDVNGSGVSQLLCQLNRVTEQALKPCQSPLNFSGLSEGPNRLVVSAIDQVGNTATQVVNWTIDTISPVIQMISAPNPSSHLNSAQFIFSAIEAGSGIDYYTCLFDSVPSSGRAVPVKCHSGVTYSSLQKGLTYSLTLIAYDRAGNSSQPVTSIWHIETLNVALQANGGVATASSTYDANYPASSTNNGDTLGINWAAGGGWNDATVGSFPDWLQINFDGVKKINEIDVFTIQDNFKSPAVPTLDMTFSFFGITDFDIQYWNGSTWVTVPGGSMTGNNKVWTRVSFPVVATDRIRILIKAASDFSRITEVEAWIP